MAEDEEGKDELSEDDVRNILKEALKMRVKDPNQKKPSKVQVNSALKAVASEFLTCFRIMGFDIDGNPVSMTIMHNKMEQSALDSLFMSEFGKFMSSRVNYE